MTTFQLKLLALLLMLIDHIGYYFEGTPAVLRLIGRLSFPLFLFCMTQGWRHTRDRKKYLLRLYGMSLVMACIMYLCGALLLPEEGQGESHAAAGGWSGNAPGGDSAEANFLSRHAHQQAQKKRCGKWVLCGGAVLYLVLMLPVEIFFRSH